MIRCGELFDVFGRKGVTFFTGVPDSTFKDWMAYLAAHHGKGLTNIAACNECEAVALAAGYHLATGGIGVVYMQNSGEGKAVNPLTSLCDPEVYSIPLIMMIGWRGEPGKTDEPQHRKMGRITLPLLETLEVPFQILPDGIDPAQEAVSDLIRTAGEMKMPVAMIIRPGTFEKFDPDNATAGGSPREYPMKREDAIRILLENLSGDEIIVSTTGKTSRELYEQRIRRGEKPKDFYTVGSMGCAASIANAIALFRKKKRIVVFDGDGAALMQMGSLATVGYYHAENLCHILFDNNSYESTGGQPTTASKVDFEKIALGCNYESAATVTTEAGLRDEIDRLKRIKGPHMTIVKVKTGSRKDLGRPIQTPAENKRDFTALLSA
jgi:phosphonopyruvate decarboxylase